MQLKNDASRYGLVAQLFHWSIVALIVTQYVLANKAEDLPLGAALLSTLAKHKSVGITILGLAVLRLIWRLISGAPVLPPATPRWQSWVARITHIALYALLFYMPLMGWAMSSARNFPVSWFGLVTLPDFVEPSKSAYEFFHEAHEIGAKVLFVLALVHIAAALKHHFINRDDVLRRMLPMRLRQRA